MVAESALVEVDLLLAVWPIVDLLTVELAIVGHQWPQVEYVEVDALNVEGNLRPCQK